MADKNRNGIDDRYEGKNGPRVTDPAYGIGQIGAWWTDRIRQSQNLAGDIGIWLSGRKPPKDPFRAGDYALGITPERAKGTPSRIDVSDLPMPSRQTAPSGPPLGNTELPSFMDYLRQAMDQVGGVGRVSYDPLRQDARGRSTEYDARIAAMYNQLQNSMRDDGKQLQGTFQGAIDDTAARGADTQQQIQAASNAADDRNLEVLRNLGIEEAQGNIVNEGRDLNTQTADAVADAAARSQISGDALQRNQTSAATHNTNLVGAAGLEGNLQRARIQSELSSLLAQYDMQEQEANRQNQQQSFAQSMGLANSMYEDAWRKQGYNDDMTKWLWEQQQAAMQPGRTDPMQYSMNFISQLQQRFPDLDPELLIKMLGPAASVGKLAN